MGNLQEQVSFPESAWEPVSYWEVLPEERSPREFGEGFNQRVFWATKDGTAQDMCGVLSLFGESDSDGTDHWRGASITAVGETMQGEVEVTLRTSRHHGDRVVRGYALYKGSQRFVSGEQLSRDPELFAIVAGARDVIMRKENWESLERKELAAGAIRLLHKHFQYLKPNKIRGDYPAQRLHAFMKSFGK